MPIRKRMLALFAAAVLLCAVSMTAFAHDVPDLSRRGSVGIAMRLGEDIVPGGQITLYRVGAVREDDGNYSFVLTGDFTGAEVTLENVQSTGLAGKLAAYAEEHGAAGETKEIDGAGMASFDDLELGLYLIVQNKAAEGYYGTAPFLVSVPMLEDGSWLYDVDASPKVELEKKPDEPETPDKPETPETPGIPDKPETPGTPDEPGTPESPGAPQSPQVLFMPSMPPSAPVTMLPQTGQLNWPVPVLAMLGLCLFSAGWALRRREKDGYEK